MSKKRLLFQTAVVLVGTAAAVTTVFAPCDAPYKPLHELRGIAAVRLNVDGMPTPPEGSGISEESLAADVKDSLGAYHVRIAQNIDFEEAPTLHITVLVQHVEGSYSYVILTRLEERCTVARNPEITIPWCEIWSAFPAIGSVAATQVADIRGKVLLPVIQFGKAYAADNER